MKIFANEVTDMKLISKIYKELKKFYIKKQTTQSTMGRRSRHFSIKDVQMAKRHMKICSTSLIIRGMQIKITMRYLTPVRMAMIKKSTNSICWRGCGKRKSSYTVGVNAN